MNINHIARAFCVLSFCTATATAQPPQPTSPRDARDEFYFMTIANKAQIVMLEEERLIPGRKHAHCRGHSHDCRRTGATRSGALGRLPAVRNGDGQARRSGSVEAPHGAQPERSRRRRESNDDPRQDAGGAGCPCGRAREPAESLGQTCRHHLSLRTPSTSRPSRFRWRTICWRFHRRSSAMHNGQLNRIDV